MVRAACIPSAAVAALFIRVIVPYGSCTELYSSPAAPCLAATAGQTFAVVVPLAMLALGLLWSLVTARLSPVGITALASSVTAAALATWLA